MRVVAVMALAVVLAVSTAVAVPTAVDATTSVQAVDAVTFGPHWSGYSRVDGSFTAVRAHLVVPRVRNDCGTGSTAAVFVSLGGTDGASNRFVQAGYTLTPSVDGVQGAWYEVMNDWAQPAPVMVPFVGRVGDDVALSLTYDRSHDAIRVIWKNSTRGTATRRTIHDAHRWVPTGRHASASWITERPNVPTVGAPMARLAPVAWTGVGAVRNGHLVDLGAHLVRHTAVGRYGRVVADASTRPTRRTFTSWTRRCA